jgi:uncharacterized protein YjiS (DUF1127 family)
MRLCYVNRSGKTALSTAKESAMFIQIITQLRQILETRRSIGDLLARADDHLLEDIGLTRGDAVALMVGTKALHRPAKAMRSAPLFA